MNQESRPPRRGVADGFRVLAGGYLLYTAWQMIDLLRTGKADSPLLCVLGGILFTAAGGFILWLEWRAYKYGKEHKDDPESWTIPEDKDHREDTQ